MTTFFLRGASVRLTFGTRFDSGIRQFGAYACDDTVLVRGTSSIMCPHERDILFGPSANGSTLISSGPLIIMG
jgi:hypothetical protein